MKTVLPLLLSLSLLVAGCIAGPTPHPGTKDDSNFQQDSVNAPPDPSAGSRERGDCEASGGFWNGSECEEGVDSAFDVVSVSDTEIESDVPMDTGPEDGVSEDSQDGSGANEDISGDSMASD